MSTSHSLALEQPGQCQTCSQHKYQSLVVANQYPCLLHEKPWRQNQVKEEKMNII